METKTDNEYIFRLRFRPPYDWGGILAFLAARATPGVEAVEGGCYRRSISCNRANGCIEVARDAAPETLVVKVRIGDPRSLFFITERIRSLFDLNADWTAIARSLGTDPFLAPQLKAQPGLRLPGCWNGFELAVRAVLGQQITVKGATLLAGRIVANFGMPFAGGNGLTHLFPTPEVLAEADLSRIGLPRSRAETLRALARAVRDGHIGFEGVVDSETFQAGLCEIPGIGPWTAQYVAMRTQGEPDALAPGDVALMRALKLKDARELGRRADVWRPWRSYAVMYLWRSSASPKPSREEASSVQTLGMPTRLEEDLTSPPL